VWVFSRVFSSFFFSEFFLRCVVCVGVCQKFSDVYLESNTVFIDTLSDNIAILINSMEVLEPKFISIDILPFVLEIICAYIIICCWWNKNVHYRRGPRNIALQHGQFTS
jgi:hypothetical protein